MKKLDGTVTLSILDEDNSQRIIFRVIPLCTKDGLIFQNRKASYPDFGSLRIIPDKREQSSFKDRMREMGSLCCVHLINDGKELTKIRQNRNYDPNQDECNQFAIYSDVICGFEEAAAFEVFQENEDTSKALTEEVLLQRGKVLFGPVPKGEPVIWESLKPFGNENFLLHTAEDLDGKQRTFYWNPDAIITWRQRKKDLKRSATHRKEEPASHAEPPALKPPEEPIPIGTKLEILNEELSNKEQIMELNLPLPDEANRLEHSDRPRLPQAPAEAPKYYGTPMTEISKSPQQDKQKNGFVHNVVEQQIKAQHSAQGTVQHDKRMLDNPVENLRDALLSVWSIPALHQEFIRLLGEHHAITQAIFESKLMDSHTKSSYSAAKAELDDIEGKRLSLLLELDKVKENYQQLKENMYLELSAQKKQEIETLSARIAELGQIRETLEETLRELGEEMQSGTAGWLEKRKTMDIKTNGSDIAISPTLGVDMDPDEIVETVRSTLSGMGFLCKRDCVTELMVMLSLHDEFCVTAASIADAELYIKTVLRALGLLSVTAWPSVFGTLHVVSLLPENNQRTPTVEVIKSKRTPVRAFGHKTIRLIDAKNIEEAGTLPVFRAPMLKTSRSEENRNETGKPISLRSIHAYSEHMEVLHTFGEEWFDALEQKLQAQGAILPDDVYHAMRVFARVVTPKLTAGFMEAADTAALVWVVPALMAKKMPYEQVASIIGDLPKCMNFAFQS